MKTDRRFQGYTLIEVLVAMAILAMSLTVLFRIFSTGLLNVDASAGYARAVIVAETQLAAIGLDAKLRQGQTEGSVEDRFYWSRTVENYVLTGQSVSQESVVSAFRVTVTVEWEQSGRIRQVSLNSVRLAPNTDGAT